MKKIKVNTNTLCSHKIKVYSPCNNLSKTLFTNEYGYAYFDPPSLGVYIFIVDSIRGFKILIDNCCDEVICLSYCNKISHPITITLTDRYYKNLPIEKGEINLWQ